MLLLIVLNLWKLNFKINNMVLFHEDTHTYYDSDTLEVLDSVSTVIGYYKNKFDAKTISEKYVKDHNLDVSASEIRQQWKDINSKAIHRGNKQHFTEEVITFLFESAHLDKNYNDYIEDLSKLKAGVYPELRLYWKLFKLAGTADKVTIYENKEFDIDDYKTNVKPMQFEGFKKQTMFYPLNDLQDCLFSHYSLQLNIYAYLLSLYGFKPRNLRIIHKRFLDDEPIPDKYKIPFMSEAKQREPKIYPVKIEIEKTLDFILYDYQRRNKQPRRLFKIS